MADATFEMQGQKQLEQMAKKMVKWVGEKKTDSAWVRIWKKTMKPLQTAAFNNAPVADKDIPYPPNKKLEIKRGTLRDSIQWFRTKTSREYNGGYLGPRVKGKFRKNKGGYYGAWIEYGDQVEHFGKHKSKKAQPFMEKAFKSKGPSVIKSIYPEAEKMYLRMAKKFAK